MNGEQLKKHIEIQIRDNRFKTKEELYKYLLGLRKREISYIITDEDIKELLKMYDELHKEIEVPLNMQNYTNKQLDKKNYIVAEEENRILKTTGNATEFITEFKETQNEILAHSQDGSTNAAEVFNKIADTQKEENKLMSIQEAIALREIDQELLHKIKYFITRKEINPYEFQVDVTNGIFYNTTNHELYEIRKNTDNNQYEIFAGGEIRYDNTNNIESSNETLENDHEEEQIYTEELEKKNIKVRKLVPTKYPNNAAFTKIGLLVVLNLVSFTVIGISLYILLLNK